MSNTFLNFLHKFFLCFVLSYCTSNKFLFFALFPLKISPDYPPLVLEIFPVYVRMVS